MLVFFRYRCGKTTLARLLAKRTNAVFKELSATDSGVGEVKAVAEEAKRFLALTGRYIGHVDIKSANLDFFDRNTILFLDEVHRFNKAQQVGNASLRTTQGIKQNRIYSCHTSNKATYK